MTGGPRRVGLWVGAGVLAAVGAGVWRRRRYLEAGRPGTGPGIRTDDDVLLHVRSGDLPVRSGDPRRDRPTVLLVHGFAASSDQMEGLRAALGDRYTVVSFDHRGHGRSGWHGPRRTEMSRLARDLALVLERRTAGPVVVVAHSMGGMAVMELARSRPELVGPVIAGAGLLSTSADDVARTVLPRRTAAVMRRTRATQSLLFLGWLLAPVVDRLQPFRRPFVRRRLGRELVADPGGHPGVARRMADERVDLPRADVDAFYPAMVEHDGAGGLEVLRRVPTLVLSGAQDRTIPPDHSRRIARSLGAKARLVLVEGTGHMVTVTHAETVAREVEELIERAQRELVERRGDEPATTPEAVTPS